jgi:hypothetical protein
MTRNATVLDFDRLPSIMFLQSAAEYILSSRLLKDRRNEADTHFGMPPFFLCGHGFKLLLKAFLKAKGWPVTKLKRTHDLSKLYEQAMGEGLQNELDQNAKAQLDLLASLGISPHFHSRYTQISGFAKPELLLLYEIYDKLDAEIRPVVEADFENWRRSMIGDAS